MRYIKREDAEKRLCPVKEVGVKYCVTTWCSYWEREPYEKEDYGRCLKIEKETHIERQHSIHGNTVI